MNTIASYAITFAGLGSMICLSLSIILLLNLIQQAFDKSGVVWGMISVFYPPGTYLYCKRNWEAYRNRFLLITFLAVVGLVLLGIIKIV